MRPRLLHAVRDQGGDGGSLRRLPRAGVLLARSRSRRSQRRCTARPQTTAHPLGAYAGTYENAAYGRVEARVEQGRLVVRMGLMSAVAEVFDGTKDQMRVELIPGQGQVITFTVTGARAESVSSDGQVFTRVKR